MPDSTSKYSYYDNLISSLSGDLDDLSVQKIQNTGDYLEESSDYDNNLFDKDSYYKALIDQQTEQKQSKEDGDQTG